MFETRKITRDVRTLHDRHVLPRSHRHTRHAHRTRPRSHHRHSRGHVRRRTLRDHIRRAEPSSQQTGPPGPAPKLRARRISCWMRLDGLVVQVQIGIVAFRMISSGICSMLIYAVCDIRCPANHSAIAFILPRDNELCLFTIVTCLLVRRNN